MSIKRSPKQKRARRTRAALKALGVKVTLAQLADRTGISAPHISRLMSGERRITLDAATRIARALKVKRETVIAGLWR